MAEWQTRTVQVRVSVRTWGFNSPLAHHICAGQSRGRRPRAAAPSAETFTGRCRETPRRTTGTLCCVTDTATWQEFAAKPLTPRAEFYAEDPRRKSDGHTSFGFDWKDPSVTDPDTFCEVYWYRQVSISLISTMMTSR